MEIESDIIFALLTRSVYTSIVCSACVRMKLSANFFVANTRARGKNRWKQDRSTIETNLNGNEELFHCYDYAFFLSFIDPFSLLFLLISVYAVLSIVFVVATTNKINGIKRYEEEEYWIKTKRNLSARFIPVYMQCDSINVSWMAGNTGTVLTA